MKYWKTSFSKFHPKKGQVPLRTSPLNQVPLTPLKNQDIVNTYAINWTFAFSSMQFCLNLLPWYCALNWIGDSIECIYIFWMYLTYMYVSQHVKVKRAENAFSVKVLKYFTIGYIFSQTNIWLAISWKVLANSYLERLRKNTVRYYFLNFSDILCTAMAFCKFFYFRLFLKLCKTITLLYKCVKLIWFQIFT